MPQHIFHTSEYTFLYNSPIKKKRNRTHLRQAYLPYFLW